MIAPTITVQEDASDLVKSLGAVVKNLPKELRIVSWKAAGKGKKAIAKEVTKELATPQKVVRAQLGQSRREPTGAEVELKKSKRIPLREFRPRQTKKGVSYRISKSAGRKRLDGAFMGPKPGVVFTKYRGHVFARAGRARLPITRLRGPSPWGVFVRNGMQRVVTPQINGELQRQLAERLRYQKLKRSGTI